MKSSFQFKNFKVDKINLQALNRLDVLLEKDNNYEVEYSFGVAAPTFYTKLNSILEGLSVTATILNSRKEKILNVEIGITGFFEFKNDEELSEDTINKIIKQQLPAILLPYARATLTNIISNAGFSSIIMPLININKAIQNKEIEIRYE